MTTASTQTIQPGTRWVRSRPTVKGYGIPDSDDGMLELDTIRERLQTAPNYWVGSASAAGDPHGVPVWGAFIDDALYFGAGPRTSHNLKANPRASVHLESATEVVVVEGRVEVVEQPEATLSKAIDDQLGAKYDWRPSTESDEPVGTGWFRLVPDRIIAWTTFPADATRWTRPTGSE